MDNKASLSPFEQKVFDYYSKKLDTEAIYEEVAKTTPCTIEAVKNAVRRVKKKLNIVGIAVDAFLKHLKTLDDDRVESRKFIFNWFEDCLVLGDFEFAEKALQDFDPMQFSDSASICVLTATRPAGQGSKLSVKVRTQLFEKVKAKLTAERPEEIEELLKGLE